MRALCLIVLVTLVLQVTSISIFKKSRTAQCCKSANDNLNSANIKSYIQTDDTACTLKAFIVKLKNDKEICANATSKNVLSAIEKFQKKKVNNINKIAKQ